MSALYFYPLKFLHFHFVLPDWYKDLTVLSIASSAISKRTYEAMYAIKPEEAEAISTANIDPVGLAGYIGYYCSWPVDKFAFAIGWVVLKLSGKIVLARATYDTLWIVIRGMLFLGLLIPFEAIASADASSGRGDKVEEGDRLFLIWYLISVFAAICISIVLYFLPELI
ncbi:MAG: hypothetical protein KGM97_06000 [Alphaproteobacteria bacterium]|nr:hypothetical protein [Alphaproteobacteria bacterium]